MSPKQQILLIALSLSFHGAVISMECQINKQLKDMEYEISQQINIINRFTDHLIFLDTKEIKPVGDWLTQKRNVIHDDVTWNALINLLLGKITFSKENDWQDASKRAVSIVIEEIARNLQPGQDYSDMLADHAVKAVNEAIDEWIEDHNAGMKINR